MIIHQAFQFRERKRTVIKPRIVRHKSAEYEKKLKDVNYIMTK